MSPIIRKPAPKKPTGRKPIRPVRKKAARPLPAGTRKPVRKVVSKRVPAAKPGAAKAARPAPVRPAKLSATAIGEQARAKAGQVMAQQVGLQGKTNQDVINVIYKAADELKMPAWSLLAKVRLEHLVDARSAPYTGPAVSALPGLTDDQKAVILKVLAGYVRSEK
jgi:hypothetical protein